MLMEPMRLKKNNNNNKPNNFLHSGWVDNPSCPLNESTAKQVIESVQE